MRIDDTTIDTIIALFDNTDREIRKVKPITRQELFIRQGKLKLVRFLKDKTVQLIKEGL